MAVSHLAGLKAGQLRFQQLAHLPHKLLFTAQTNQKLPQSQAKENQTPYHTKKMCMHLLIARAWKTLARLRVADSTRQMRLENPLLYPAMQSHHASRLILLRDRRAHFHLTRLSGWVGESLQPSKKEAEPKRTWKPSQASLSLLRKWHRSSLVGQRTEQRP